MKDGWDIATTIATGVTAIIAMYLAIRQEILHRREAAVRANVIAAALAPRLESLNGQLRIFSAGLAFTDVDTGKHRTPEREAGEFLKLDRLSVPPEELSALSTLGNNCAYRLSRAISLLDLARARISEHVKETRNFDDPLSEERAAEWSSWVDDALALFEMAERQCRQAALIPAAAPSGEERYGDLV